MTKEEILKKIELQQAEEKDLFEYYGIRNKEGLELVLEEKFSKPLVNINYIYQGFDFIYKCRLEENYNPMEEKFRYFSIVLPAFYQMETIEVAIITGTMGVFEGIMFLDNLLKDRVEVKYFDNLYKLYLNRKADVGIILEENFNKLNKLIDEKMSKLKIEDLKNLGDLVMKEIEKVTTKAG
jgi:hypothetical protein